MATNPQTAPPRKHPHPRIAKTLAIAGLVVCMVFGFLFVAILYARKHAEPIVRARIIQTLEERLHANVQLDRVKVSVITGSVQVGGSGLRITAPSGQPLLSAKGFEFSTSLNDLVGKKSKPVKVRVQGLDIHIPAGPERAAISAPIRKGFRNRTPRIFSVVEVIATDSTLSIDRLDPSKAPLVFDIDKIRFTQSLPGQPFAYDATLINPKPVGEIHSVGRFGPWNGNAPRDTPLRGSFTFTDADLSTISGIRGHLQGQGSINGTLGEITTDGSTHVPDFGIDPGTNTAPLDTTFHAIVDGTTGDVDLQPVNARLLNTSIFCAGKVVRVQGNGDRVVHGHDITLDTDIRGRVEDILKLVTKGKAPLMRAALGERGHLHIPPGKQRVITRIDIAGHATLLGTVWSDPDTQQKVNSLSMRAQGQAKQLAKDENDHDPSTNPPAVTSAIQTQFKLAGGTLHLSSLTYTMPGATVTMAGTFNIPADSLDFHGQVRTEAGPSQMLTGWKSFLLKPFDPFFKRNGAGLQLPISLTGSPSKPHVGLDLGHHKDSAPQPKQ